MAKLVRWLGDKKGISAPTVWLLGAQLADRFGWLAQADDKKATAEWIRADLKAAFQTASVTPVVQKSAYRFTVFPHWQARERPIAEIVVARLGKLTDGHRGVLDDLVTDDPEGEIVHRIQWITENLRIDATGPAATLGARLAESIWKPPPVEGVWPLGDDLEPTRFEPSFSAKIPDAPPGHKVVVVDQRRAVLAAVGTARLGMGQPERMPGGQVDWHDPKVPDAVVEVELPALEYLAIPPILRVHRAQQASHAVRAVPVCTRTVQQMIAGAADGGLGLDVDDIKFGEAWVFPHTGKKLESWAAAIRKAFTAAAGDPAVEAMLKAIYQRYYMAFSLDHTAGTCQHQPAWSGDIRAHVRATSLRYAARIHRDHKLLPVAAQMDAWYYIVPDDFDTTIFDDTSELNGKYRVKEEIPHVSEETAPATTDHSQTATPHRRSGLLHRILGRASE
ncbi:hypothetical protein [Mycobacterium talmoniae]|uniref:hypothetical protein n=1 Tax=Mycobacterium talmoniae TaxID=1858794 RepID=UPI000AFA1564|nr:hypothetical protein [Mycobacterium talmoniae]